MEKRFLVQFTKKSLKEYEALDGSIIEEVNTALESLEQRADQVGKLLGNKRQIHLKGTKEKKLRRSGGTYYLSNYRSICRYSRYCKHSSD
ncbi:hypothetical protein [Paenibacillus nuruki]|uniref:hypothetical protein n=1 Tax=Paenibacillus nuruki TaxID=1886670 RepID=UPI0015868A3E|nr:hypothetical protein [Paenibacillus nuruki]